MLTQPFVSWGPWRATCRPSLVTSKWGSWDTGNTLSSRLIPTLSAPGPWQTPLVYPLLCCYTHVGFLDWAPSTTIIIEPHAPQENTCFFSPALERERNGFPCNFVGVCHCCQAHSSSHLLRNVSDIRNAPFMPYKFHRRVKNSANGLSKAPLIQLEVRAAWDWGRKPQFSGSLFPKACLHFPPQSLGYPPGKVIELIWGWGLFLYQTYRGQLALTLVCLLIWHA